MSALSCGFVGLGLIGGSIAKALRNTIPEIRIIAYDTNVNTLESAKKDGVLNAYSTAIDSVFSECDYIFLCAPVSHNNENLLQLRSVINENAILTDVGSVKTPIHKAISEEGLEAHFIGGHPMAGSERFGYANSNPILLENAYYILTPTASVSPERVTALQTLVQTIGAIPLVLSADQHDYVTGAVSHLPHVIAAALVNLVHDSDSKEGLMKMIAAGGFKDITRIASSSPTMWQQICLTNTENISQLLSDYIASLTRIKNDLDARSADSLYDFFDAARGYRESFIGTSSGPIKSEYVCTVDIADKPGSIAAIASLLAMHGVSIKNIGINHNREFQEGALRIEFYNEKMLLDACTILKDHGYSIHEKRSE